MADEQEVLNRWRLVLGSFAKEHIAFSSTSGEGGQVEGRNGLPNHTLHYMEMEEVLDYLYLREYGEEQEIRGQDNRQGGKGGSSLTVPKWIERIRKLFPKQTVEVMERHALEKYGMTELLTDPEVLKKLEPNQELLKTILELKHMMKGNVLSMARQIVQKVVDELTKKLEHDMKRALFGRIDRTSGSPVRSLRNLDIKKTIQRNLKNYDREKEQIVLKQVYFHSRVKKYNKWNIIICIDESGSMMDSVIYSAVMAGIFAKLPMLSTKLVIFDTNVVDLSGYVEDPVEILMSVQLGGGTNIAHALKYCEGLMEFPYRTILVLVTDLYEGGGYHNLYNVSRGIIESGAKMMVLTALDVEANPNYDRTAAAVLADMGASVGAMTPEQLADWVAKIL